MGYSSVFDYPSGENMPATQEMQPPPVLLETMNPSSSSFEVVSGASMPQHVGPPPGLEEESETMNPTLPSVGSIGHFAGTCRPCAHFHRKQGGCKNGKECIFCHLCDDKEIKRRKSSLKDK